MKIANLENCGPYEIVYADPPWSYPSIKGITKIKEPDGSVSYKTGSPCGADAHYKLMTQEALASLPVKHIMAEKSALFMWATCPRLDKAITLIESWGLFYRGVAYVWVKTKKDGALMGAKGPMPSFVKPTVELCLVATTIAKGRVFPLLEYNQRQVIMEPVREHSRKPDAVRSNIRRLCGDRKRIELFARKRYKNWDCWGVEV